MYGSELGPSLGRAHRFNLRRLLFYGGLNYTGSTVPQMSSMSPPMMSFGNQPCLKNLLTMDVKFAFIKLQCALKKLFVSPSGP